jgi:hypothetical protein
MPRSGARQAVVCNRLPKSERGGTIAWTLERWGCRHAPQVVRGRTAVDSPPPLVDRGMDGSIST